MCGIETIIEGWRISRMKCTNCGAEIPVGEVQCSFCGMQVQLVPDYNPLDEVVADEIRFSLEGRERQDEGEFSRGDNLRRNTGQMRNSNTGQMRRGNTGELRQKEIAMRKRRQAEKRREEQKKKRIRLIISLSISAVVIAGAVFLFYQNSYSGLVSRGGNAHLDGKTEEAIKLYEEAIAKDKQNVIAYLELADVYMSADMKDEAKAVLLEGYDSNKENSEIAKAVMDFYLDTKTGEEVTPFFKELNDSLQEELSDYHSVNPEFSLDSGIYEDVQELTISNEGGDIYYTMDDSSPLDHGIKVTEPLQLEEGTLIVKAVSYNKIGVPSEEITMEYEITLPMAGAPIVNPSTGQYSEATEITVTVPEGYRAYYTLDGTTPTESSQLYAKPIEMPVGNTIFSAVLVNSSGKTSDVTKRNYSLDLAEVSQSAGAENTASE